MDRGVWQATGHGVAKSQRQLERLSMHSSVGDEGSIPRSGRSPGKGDGNPSSILAWEMPWTEEPGRPQFMGLQKGQTRFSD